MPNVQADDNRPTQRTGAISKNRPSDPMEATKARNAALALFGKSLSRYRHYLCAASDDLDQSPELRKGGFKVRKDRTKTAKKTTEAKATTPAPPPAKG